MVFNSFKKNKNTEIIFFLILILAFSLRLLALDHFDTWGDEKLSVQEANGMLTFEMQNGNEFTKKDIEKNNTLHNVILSTIKGDGGNGILYIASLHFWTHLFGNSDFAVRFLSVIMGLLVVFLTYYLSLELFTNKNLALLSMLLIAIHPHLISFSQETRAYSFALFFTLLATFLLFRMERNKNFNNANLIFYMLLAAASFLSHYSTVYIFFAHIFLLLFIFKIDWKSWKKILLFSLIPISLISIWLISYGFDGLNIIAARNLNYSKLTIIDPTNSFYMRTGFYSICAGWAQNILIFTGNTLINLGLRILIVLPLILIPIVILYHGLKNADEIHLKKIKILIILTISSLIYATILSLISGHIISFQHLYSIFSTPYSILILSYSIFLLKDLSKSKWNYIHRTFIFLQFSILLFSTSLIYFGYDSHTKSRNYFIQTANDIEKATIHADEDVIVSFKERETALEINKYISHESNNLRQKLDTNSNNSKISILYLKRNIRHVLLK